MHRRHHKLQHRIDDPARLLGIEVAHQLRRALDVGKQSGDRLTLTLQAPRRLPIMSDFDAWSFRSSGRTGRIVLGTTRRAPSDYETCLVKVARSK
jgi:hypothetical protein